MTRRAIRTVRRTVGALPRHAGGAARRGRVHRWRRRRGRRRPGRSRRLRGRRRRDVTREVHAADGPRLVVQRLRRRGPRRREVRVRPGPERLVRARAHRCSRRTGPRMPATALVRSCGRPRRARGPGSSSNVARTRDSSRSSATSSRSCSPRSSSRCRGRWPRRWAGPTSPSGSRTCSRSRRTRAAGLRSAIPSGAPFRLGKTNPNFSTSGLSALDRPVLRGDRQDQRSHAGGSRPARRPRLRIRGRVVGGALRRHDLDVPQQLVPQRHPRHRAHLRVGGRGRGEVGHRLQPRRSRRHPGPGGAAAEAAGAARRHLPDARARVFSDNPFIVLDAPWVTPDQKEAANRFDEYVRAPAEPGARPRVRVPARQPPRRDRRADRRRQRGRSEATADDARRARARGAGGAHRPVGAQPQAGAGAAHDRRLGLDGGAGRPGDRRDEARPREAGRGHRARRVPAR